MSDQGKPEDFQNGRPFPWCCPRCRRREVWRTTLPYECQRLLEGQTVTVSLQAFAVPQCRNCGELVFDYVAEEQINQACLARTHLSKREDAGANGIPYGDVAKQKL